MSLARRMFVLQLRLWHTPNLVREGGGGGGWLGWKGYGARRGRCKGCDEALERYKSAIVSSHRRRSH